MSNDLTAEIKMDAMRKLYQALMSVDVVPVVRCKECKHRFVDGENVRFNVCEMNHNKVQSDDWFCADGERRSDEDQHIYD